MAEKFRLVGLDNFEMGDVGSNDTMGTSLTSYSGTKLGTFTLNFPEPDIADIQIEEDQDPLISVINAGAKDFTLELIDLTLTELQKFMGGTYTAGSGGDRSKLELPSTFPTILQSVKLTSKNGDGEPVIINVPKCQVIASLPGTNPTKTDAFGVTVRFKILSATDDLFIEVGDPVL